MSIELVSPPNSRKISDDLFKEIEAFGWAFTEGNVPKDNDYAVLRYEGDITMFKANWLHYKSYLEYPRNYISSFAVKEDKTYHLVFKRKDEERDEFVVNMENLCKFLSRKTELKLELLLFYGD